MLLPTIGTQTLHASADNAKFVGRTTAMTTRRFSDQVIKCVLGIHDAYGGRIKVNGTDGLHDGDCRFGG